MCKNLVKVFFMLIVFSGLLPSPALSHGGGTDANGCHANSKTGDYHCHLPKTSSSSARSAPAPSSETTSIAYMPKKCVNQFDLYRLLSQADNGYIRAHCGKSFLLIKSH